jgi:GTP:adenosylcobinamide-phosphate guanylyltransferase
MNPTELSGITVLILAGGAPDDPFAQEHHVAHPCLIELGGQSIISRMVTAFQNTPGLTEIIVVGLPAVLQALPENIKKVAAAETFSANLSLGVAACQTGRLIVTPSDVPWITPEVISEFVTKALACNADLVFPIVAKEIYEKRFPGGRRTYVKLREGSFTFANMTLFSTELLRVQLPIMQGLFAGRKSPLALVRIFGLSFILKFLLHRLDLPALEARASRILSARAAALVLDRPEMAFDVDKPADYTAAQAVLAEDKRL